MSTIPPGLSGMLNPGDPVEPRPSASVLLARGDRPWQVLMMRRPGGAEFAPGAYVFPGGSVHAEDSAFEDAIAAAAVRELFEEVGVLLARRDGAFARDPHCAALRQALEAGSGFGEALAGLGLEPAFDQLTLFTRWITPLQLRRRFDTRFYIARLPESQTIHHQPGEVEDWLWLEPSEALQGDRLTLVHATRQILGLVSGQPDLERLLEGFRGRPVEPNRPVLRQLADGGWEIITPG
jgi:8-oxo-dGTP pyrophosphatase MutT (NUDIX family)